MFCKLTLFKWNLFLFSINYHMVCQEFTAESHILVVFGVDLANWSEMSSCNFVMEMQCC